MTTPIFNCGLECGDTVGGEHWILGGITAATVSTATIRSGLRSLRCRTTTASTSEARHSLPSAVPVAVHRVYWYLPALPNGPVQVMTKGSGSGAEGIYLIFDSASDPRLYVGNGTTFGATGVPVIVGQWCKLDFRYNGTSNPHLLDAMVDGMVMGQASIADSASSESLVALGWSGMSIVCEMFFDDFVMSATSADYPIGDGYGAPFLPTSDGTHNIAGAADFQRGTTGTDILNATTTAYQLIDDLPIPTSVVADDFIAAIAPPNATDYVEVVFGPAGGLAVPTTAPQAVEVLVSYHQAATQSGNIRLALNDNGTLDDVLNLTAAGVTTLRYATKQYADPPSAVSAWNVNNDGSNGDFRDLRMRFFSSDAAPDQYWDSALIEADFPSPALLPNQLLAIGTTTNVTDNVRATMPNFYEVQDTVSETTDTIVTTTLSSFTADGETPQQQAVVESQGGDSVGQTNISPGVQVDASVEVTGAETNVELLGTES